MNYFIVWSTVSTLILVTLLFIPKLSALVAKHFKLEEEILALVMFWPIISLAYLLILLIQKTTEAKWSRKITAKLYAWYQKHKF